VVLTELGKAAWDNPNGDAIKKLIPTGRFLEPEEVAATAIFLASDASDMINGADLLIDGGYTVRQLCSPTLLVLANKHSWQIKAPQPIGMDVPIGCGVVFYFC
jgi:hypothetical protein